MNPTNQPPPVHTGGETLPAYLRKIFSRRNIPNELRDWNHHAGMEHFRFSAFADHVERHLDRYLTHPRFVAISLFARHAVELTAQALKGHIPPERFLVTLDELENAIINRPTAIPTEQLELVEHNLTDRRQWITSACWLPARHALAILPPEALKLELLEALTKITLCPKSI